MNKLEQSVDFNASDIAELKRDQLELKIENENLKKQLLYSDSYSRRENLKFIGIVENTSDSANNQNAAKSSDSLQSEDTKDVLFKFLEDELNITDARKRIEFQSVDRLGKLRSSGNPRPIIARFLRTRIEKKLCKKLERNWRARITRFLKTSQKSYTNLEKGSRTNLNAPSKMVLRLSSSRNFRTGCTLTVNLYL